MKGTPILGATVQSVGTTKSEILPGSETAEAGGEDTISVIPKPRLIWNHWLDKGSIAKYADFLDSVLESLPDPFYLIDASDLTVKMSNSAVQFGPLSEESTCYALTNMSDSPCDSEEHPCPVDEIRKTKRPLTVEHVHCDKGGNPRNVEIHAFPVLDKAEDVSQIIEYVLHVTERKQAEEALKWELTVNSALAKL